MAQTPEGKVKDWLSNQIKKKFPSAWVYKAPGGRFGRAGIPDLLCCIDSLFISIEVKTDKGVISPKQQYEADLIIKAGGYHRFIFGKDEVVLNEVFTYIQENSNG